VLDVTDTPGGSVLSVRVIPRAKHTKLDGVRAGAMLVRLSAAPVDGAANDALLLLLSKALMVPRRSLQIVSGLKDRDKRIAIQSLSADDVRRRLNVR
jgi:uncharacterized protein YggU (UPF0235/DUF167 family)